MTDHKSSPKQIYSAMYYGFFSCIQFNFKRWNRSSGCIKSPSYLYSSKRLGHVAKSNNQNSKNLPLTCPGSYFRVLTEIPKIGGSSLLGSRRGVSEMTSLLLFTKLLAGSSIIYGLYRYVVYSDWYQKRKIIKSFMADSDIPLDESIPVLKRGSEEAFLKRWFVQPPSGPIVLAGPVGSGRSHLIKRVLKGRKMAVYVDFRKEPVVSGEEYIAGFVTSAGYRIPQATEIMRMFTREEQRKTKITSHEADKALKMILDVLNKCKKEKWNHGVPLICLDDVYVPSGQKSSNNSNHPELDVFWTKFLDWCAYVSDAKLAHVVFVPSQSYEPHSPMYEHPIFRTKRILLFVDYPDNTKVRKYVDEFLAKECSTNLDLIQSSPEHLRHMKDWIVNCLGGQFDDLMHILLSLKRGDLYGAVLRRMITDSVSNVESKLEQVLSEAHPQNANKEEVFKKYLRLWAAMETLRDNEIVNRRDIVKNIFKEHTEELKQYIEWGLFAYANQKAEIDDPANNPTHPSANGVVVTDDHHHFIDTSNNNYLINSHSKSIQTYSEQPTGSTRYPSWWSTNVEVDETNKMVLTASIASTSSGTGIVINMSSESQLNTSISSDQSSPIPSTVSDVSSPAQPTNITLPDDSSTKSVETTSNESTNQSNEANQRTSKLLHASLESMLVTAGSPRLRIAFDLLLNDPRLSDRAEFLAIHLKLKTIKDGIELAEKNKKILLEERIGISNSLDNFINHLATWKEEFGNEFVESKKKRLISEETELQFKLDQTFLDITKKTNQKNQLEEELKKLSVQL